MDNTLKLTETYWEMLKSLNDDIKLRLATRLTASVIAGKDARKNRTDEMIEKHLGNGRMKETIDCIMVTENVKHLNRIENIQIENWITF